MKKFILGCLVALLCTGCMGGNSKVEDGMGQKQLAWTEFQEERPDAGFESVENAPADLTLKGVADLYGTTCEILDKTVEQTEHCQVAMKLETVRENQGEETFKKELDALEGQDKKDYEIYVNNEIDSLEVVVKYAAVALELEEGLTSLDPSSLASNPFKLGGVSSTLSHSKDQIEFTTKALAWLKEYKDSLEMARSYQGR